nr:hypothetical protein [Tanacetum cinerariifolium]
MNQNHFEHNPSYNFGFNQPPHYSIDHQLQSIQEDLNQQKMNDVDDRWNKMVESGNKIIQLLGEMILQQKQAANIDQSPPQEMSIQDMEDLKQQYLDEMKSMINQIQIEDYRNKRIDIYYRRECEIKIDELRENFNGMSIEINKKKELQQLEQTTNLIPSSIAITPVLLTKEPEDSLTTGDKDLSTIPEKESDEVIKYSVEDLVPIPSESEDTSESDSECDLSLCDDSSPIDILEGKSITLSNPLFDLNDFTSSDDESLSDEDVPEYNNIKNKDLYDSNLDEPDLLVTPLSDANEDECFNSGGDIDEIDAFDIPSDFKDGYYDSEGDVLYLESLISDDTTPNLPPEDRHYLFFTYVIRIFLPYFTYPVDSPFLLSSGSEGTIFDPDISAFHFSLEPMASHQSGTFICFNVYPNILNESLMEICSSTRFNPNITMISGLPRIMKTLVLVVLSIIHSSFSHFHAYMGIRYPRSY